MVPTEATDEVGHIHDRMPMSVAAENWADWLDPTNTVVDYARSLMARHRRPAASYPVSTAVNNVHPRRRLLKPITVEDAH